VKWEEGEVMWASKGVRRTCVRRMEEGKESASKEGGKRECVRESIHAHISRGGVRGGIERKGRKKMICWKEGWMQESGRIYAYTEADRGISARKNWMYEGKMRVYARRRYEKKRNGERRREGVRCMRVKCGYMRKNVGICATMVDICAQKMDICAWKVNGSELKGGEDRNERKKRAAKRKNKNPRRSTRKSPEN
jgi:hypothetical protein